jgi:tetratricopeptide (TPR) repeat protein
MIHFVLILSFVCKADETQWWKAVVTACVRDAEGDGLGALGAWELAAREAPDSGLVLYEYGLCLAREGQTEQALEVLASASEDPAVLAHAEYAAAQLLAQRGEKERCRAALESALDAGLCPPRGSLKRDRSLAKIQKEPWFKTLVRGRAGPVQIYEDLLKSGAYEELVTFFRARNLRWIGEQPAPAYLLLRTLRELGEPIAAGKQPIACELEQLTLAARAADEALSTDAFSAWVTPLLEMDRSSARIFLDNWRALDAQGPLFRGHRFRELMRRFVPIERSAREMGDRFGALCARTVLAATRTCLNEYGVSGFDLEEQWAIAWEDLDQILVDGQIFGEWDAAASACELRLELFGHLPSDAIRTQFLTASKVASTYVQMTLLDLRMPRTDRKISWSHERLRKQGLVYE